TVNRETRSCTSRTHAADYARRMVDPPYPCGSGWRILTSLSLSFRIRSQLHEKALVARRRSPPADVLHGGQEFWSLLGQGLRRSRSRWQMAQDCGPWIRSELNSRRGHAALCAER